MNEDILINNDIIQLLHKKMEGISSDAHEEDMINEWAQRSVLHRQVIDRLMNEQDVQAMIRERLTLHKEKEIAWREVAMRTVDRVSTENISRHRVHFLKTAWFKYAAAIIIIVGIGAYLWNTTQKEKPLITETQPVPVKNDVAPGGTKATLTLSDGRKVELTPETGTIAESGINIENENGRLEYGKADKVVFNTMTTPRGGQYQLTLPDGTNVWLNAASSVTYPTAFVSNTREVTITGEAYFEVTKDHSKPFIVKTPEEDITVLGTSFNVNAYENEHSVKTSLLEGSVKIRDTNIKPGQAYQDGKVSTTNIEQDLAWKNGVFDFTNLTLQQAMKQIERWYDIKVMYEGSVSQTQLVGKIDRKTSLKGLLKGLEGMVGRFRLEGKVLFVKSL